MPGSGVDWLPVPRREIAALERAADEAWPAPVRERLGDWLLRAADGWTVRGNSALPVGQPGVPLREAVEAVRQWYHARGLPARMNVPLPLAARVDAALSGRGWQAAPRVLVQTAPLATVLAALPDRTDLPPVALSADLSPEWLALAAERKGELPASAYHLLRAGGRVPVRFAYGYRDRGELVAVGRGSISGGGRWLGLMQIDVAPHARRLGWGRQVIAALARWAGTAGATDVFLQVEERNTAAIGLYRTLGFRTHHTYLTRYLERPPASLQPAQTGC